MADGTTCSHLRTLGLRSCIHVFPPPSLPSSHMKTALFAALLAVCLQVDGAVNLTFSDSGGFFSGVSDSAGTAPVNDLLWGILIDTNEDGLPMNGASLALTGSTGLDLVNGVDLGDGDLFFFGEEKTFGFTPSEGDPVNGTIGSTGFLSIFSMGNNVDQGDPFHLLWWGDTSIGEDYELLPGTPYGLFSDSSFTIPADTADTSFSASIASSALKPANQSLVPEPATSLLPLLLMSLLMHRKR